MKHRTKTYLMVVTAIIILAIIAGITIGRITGNVISGNAIASNANAIQDQLDVQQDALAKINTTLNNENDTQSLLDSINKYAQTIYNASLIIQEKNKVHYGGGGSSGGISGGGVS